ncbi:MAG: SdpI family protein [Candidatus Pelagibacter ubique]
MCFLKENGFVGFRTPTTLSNPYIWKNTNKHTGLMLVILGIVCFFPALSGNIFLFTLLLLIGSLGIFVFGLIYSNKLREKLREKKDYTSNFLSQGDFVIQWLFSRSLWLLQVLLCSLFLQIHGLV